MTMYIYSIITIGLVLYGLKGTGEVRLSRRSVGRARGFES